MCEGHSVFRSYVRVGAAPAPGFAVDSFLGARSRVEFVAGPVAQRVRRGSDCPVVAEEYFEWIDLPESVEAARGS